MWFDKERIRYTAGAIQVSYLMQVLVGWLVGWLVGDTYPIIIIIVIIIIIIIRIRWSCISWLSAHVNFHFGKLPGYRISYISLFFPPVYKNRHPHTESMYVRYKIQYSVLRKLPVSRVGRYDR